MSFVRFMIVPVVIAMLGTVAWGTGHAHPAGSKTIVTHTEQSSPKLSSATQSGIGGSFELINQNKRRVTDKDFRGKLMLVFFGFTRCPDECPLAVGNMNAALQMFDTEVQAVVPVFITVDPRHDSPKVLKNYIASLDPHWIALTGTPAQLEKARQAYKVYAQTHTGERGKANIDHSAYIYLMGRDGAFLTHFRNSATPKELADGILKHL